jgi:hypothetical protein
LPLVPTTDDTAGSDELKATTVDDEKADDLTLVPETDDAAVIDEVNDVTIGGDEEVDGLLLATLLAPSPVCYALLYS